MSTTMLIKNDTAKSKLRRIYDTKSIFSLFSGHIQKQENKHEIEHKHEHKYRLGMDTDKDTVTDRGQEHGRRLGKEHGHAKDIDMGHGHRHVFAMARSNLLCYSCPLLLLKSSDNLKAEKMEISNFCWECFIY
jgi:hypothetical protein